MSDAGALAPPHPVGGHHRQDPLRFGGRVVLSKEEAFGACQVLADAGRHLVRAGATGEADLLGELFELIEERLARG